MIDTVTIAFQEELPVLRAQAQSLDLYCADIGIKNVWVIVNDHAGVADLIDPAWWGHLSSRVRIIARDHWAGEYATNGWLTQQLLKMRGAELSANDYSMISVLFYSKIYEHTWKSVEASFKSFETQFENVSKLKTIIYDKNQIFGDKKPNYFNKDIPLGYKLHDLYISELYLQGAGLTEFPKNINSSTIVSNWYGSKILG